MDFDDITEQTLRLRRGEKWNRYPSDVLPAWVADMDYVVADPIRAALTERIGCADLGYPLPHRRTALPELFRDRVAERFAWSVDAGDVVIINDVVQGLYLGLQTLSQPGDGVIIQTPIYPPFLRAAAQTGRRTLSCPLVSGATQFEIDFDEFEAAIDGTTRILMLCNPHNPCGRAFSREELERIAEICCRHELIVLSDEIHADLILGDNPHIPIASLGADIAARTITLMSASKAFNIAGLCLAFAHISDPELKRRFANIPPHTRGGMNALSLAAVEAAWRSSQDWQDRVLATLRSNRDRVGAWVAAHCPDVKYFPAQATYLAWLDMRPLALDQGAQPFFLEQARVALSEGSTFGPEGEGFVRLNFATTPDLLDEILARMAAALDAR